MLTHVSVSMEKNTGATKQNNELDSHFKTLARSQWLEIFKLFSRGQMAVLGFLFDFQCFVGLGVWEKNWSIWREP